MELIEDPLGLSLRLLDERRHKKVLQEARDREWPSIVLEDLLDAEEVNERTEYPPSIVWPFGPMC